MGLLQFKPNNRGGREVQRLGHSAGETHSMWVALTSRPDSLSLPRYRLIRHPDEPHPGQRSSIHSPRHSHPHFLSTCH